jgi:hypothetical protein
LSTAAALSRAESCHAAINGCVVCLPDGCHCCSHDGVGTHLISRPAILPTPSCPAGRTSRLIHTAQPEAKLKNVHCPLSVCQCPSTTLLPIKSHIFTFHFA